jgi:hypothetical protein
MHNTINTYLNKAKAPASLTISGIQWNWRGNITLLMLNKFMEEEWVPHLLVIEEQVKEFGKLLSIVDKQETWTQLIVHQVDTHPFPDIEEGKKVYRKNSRPSVNISDWPAPPDTLHTLINEWTKPTHLLLL